MFGMFDPMYWLIVGPTALLALWAQMKVKSTYRHYSQVRTSTGYNGAQAAQIVLQAAGVDDVSIEQSRGMLSDHYDPTSRTLRLSPDVFHGNSVAAFGIAAHEAGHAIQHARAYAFLALRSLIVPVAQFGGYGMWIIFAGMLFGSLGLIKIGIFLFAGICVFQIVTLPVEIDASARAKRALADTGLITSREEQDGVRSVLSAAAWTYVAATIASVATLLYYLMRFGLLGSRDD